MQSPLAKLREFARCIRDATRTYGVSASFVINRFARLYLLRQFSPGEIFGQGLVDPSLDTERLDAYISKEQAWRWYAPINDRPQRRTIDDKWQFHRACAAHGLPTPKLLGVFQRAGSPSARADADSPATRVEWEAFLRQRMPSRFIAKPSLGLKGYGVTLIEREGDRFSTHDGRTHDAASLVDYFDEIVKVPTIHPEYGQDEHAVVLQETLESHPDLAALSGTKAIQCIRVCTYAGAGREPRILFAFLKIISGDNMLDNFDRGRTGNLLGFLNESQGTMFRVIGRPNGCLTARSFERHPNSGVNFRDFRVPMWQAVCELAKQTASAFRPVGAVGWDLAVTPQGPVVIEGNTTWDPVAPFFVPFTQLA